VVTPAWAARHRLVDTVMRLKNGLPAAVVDIEAGTYEERLRTTSTLVRK